MKFPRIQFSAEIAVRVFADALLVNAALLSASAIGYYSMVDLQGETVALVPVTRVAAAPYGQAVWLLTPSREGLSTHLQLPERRMSLGNGSPAIFTNFAPFCRIVGPQKTWPPTYAQAR